MNVPLGIRYFFGSLKLSVRNHPPMLAGLPLRLRSSIESVGGGGSLWVSTSFMTTGGITGGGPSSRPGEPLSAPLGRQLSLRPHVFNAALSLTMTSEKPKPSVIGYHWSL